MFIAETIWFLQIYVFLARKANNLKLYLQTFPKHYAMSEKRNDEKLKIDISQIPVDGSLGLLAYGDIAFAAWRKIKQESAKNRNEKE